MLIEPVDAGDDAVGFVGVGGDREPRQQRVAPGVLVGVGGGRRGRRRRIARARGRGDSQQTEEDEERPTRHDGQPKASPR